MTLTDPIFRLSPHFIDCRPRPFRANRCNNGNIVDNPLRIGVNLMDSTTIDPFDVQILRALAENGRMT
ncbi:MAG: hypothetical protein VW474_15350, partial [Paracoccaceae bacterium]